MEAASSVLPCIVVLEDIDFLACLPKGGGSDQRKLLYQLLDLIDTLEEQVLVIGTTHNYKDIEPALRRGGRLDFEVRFDMPTAQDRESILRIYLGDNQIEGLEMLARQASGFVGSDLA